MYLHTVMFQPHTRYNETCKQSWLFWQVFTQYDKDILTPLSEEVQITPCCCILFLTTRGQKTTNPETHMAV